MPSENYIWKLFARCLNGEASAEESVRLHELLSADESLQQRYEILKQFWNSPQTNSFENVDEAKIERIIKKAQEADGLSFRQQKERRKRRTRRRAQLVMGLAVLAASALVYISLEKRNNNTSSTAQAEKQQLVAQKGSRSKTILPDGSVVWLNAGSSLSYAGKCAAPNREVFLNGEAFFDVVKDTKRPFIVHANGIDIRVLGTSFDVKSYSDERKVEATLIRGLIQITRPGNRDQKPLYLHPNEKLVIDLAVDEPYAEEATQNAPQTLPAFTLFRLDSNLKTENRIETAWVYDRLQFRGENFEELARKLERWYNVTIIFQDEEVKQLSFNGSFENETVQQAFAALKAAVPFDYSINEHEIFIRSAKKAVP